MLRLVLACLLLALVAAPAANAAGAIDILRDCADDGVLQGHYSPSELRKARDNIPTDTDQYTDCRDVLDRAVAAALSRGGTGGGAFGGGGGGTAGGESAPLIPSSPEDQKALDDAYRNGHAPQTVGGQVITPGAAGLAAAAARHPLPSTLVVLLALTALLALGAALPHVRHGAWQRLASVAGGLRSHVGRG